MTNAGRIGVIFGGASPEHDISVLTGLQAARILSEAGGAVVCIYWSRSGTWLRVPTESEPHDFLSRRLERATELRLLVPGGFAEMKRLVSRELHLDVVLNTCHGGAGEDGGLASMLRLAGLAVSGPPPAAAALAMDKLATYAFAKAHDIPTIPTASVRNAESVARPWIIKPRYGGSSIGVEAGISDVDTLRSLTERAAHGPYIVQPYLDGWVDLNVAVRSSPQIQVSAVERPVRGDGNILDYYTKYLSGSAGMDSSPRELPARIPGEIESRIAGFARTFFEASGMTGAPRFDFLWDGGDQLALCEANTIPGALAMYLWEATGVPRHQFLQEILSEARASSAPAHWHGEADGAALRSASSIAAKLAL